MKHFLFLSAFVLLFAAQAATAQNVTRFEERWYAGLGYTYNQYQYDDGLDTLVAEDFHGAKAYVGYYWHDNFAFELGYQHSASEEQSGTFGGSPFTTETTYNTVYTDFVANYPVAENIAWLGTIGAGFVWADVDITQGASFSTVGNDTTSFRLGTGFEYTIPDSNFGIRTMGRYIGTGFKSAKHNLLLEVSGNYRF
jgi:opacity protein-like surface antigen